MATKETTKDLEEENVLDLTIDLFHTRQSIYGMIIRLIITVTSHPVALLSTRSMEDSASLLVGGEDIPFILFIRIQ